MQFFKTLILVLLSSLAFGQTTFNYPKVPLAGKDYKSFFPTGWSAIDTAEGDLNKDLIADAALVLQQKKSFKVDIDGDTLEQHPRILIILLKDAQNKTFKLVAQSNSFIINAESSMQEDPFQEIKINKGLLTTSFQIFYNMGSWEMTSTSYKFRYQNNQFALIGADYFSIHRASLNYEDYSFNFLSKKRSYIRGNEGKGTKSVVKWASVAIKELKTLESFKSPFTWEVEKGLIL
jgi:hypothetical protein